jgi:hypothetical protein
MNQPPQYVAARLRRTFAEDPRTAEQGVQVEVRGSQVFLRGDVTCTDRRDVLTRVAIEALPDYTVHNEVMVVSGGAPEGEEELR